MAGTRDIKVLKGNDFSRSYSSSIWNKRYKGAREEMTSAGTVVQMEGTRDT